MKLGGIVEEKITYKQVLLSALQGNEKSKKILINIWQILADDYYLSVFEDKDEYKQNNNDFSSFIIELINLIEEQKEDKILPEDINKYIEIEMKEIPLQRKRTYCSYE